LYDQDVDSNIAPFVYATDLSANGTYLKKRNTDCAVSQGRGFCMGLNSTFLLDEGDELQISDSVTLIYRSCYDVCESAFTLTQMREKSSFASRYLVTGRLLGEGAFGKVLVGVNQKTQGQVACKLVRLDCVEDQGSSHRTSATTKGHRLNLAKRYREFDILKDLSHPNIVAIEKVFWSQSTIYIFEELVTGGDLFSFLAYKNGRLDSILAAVIIRQMLKGLEYLHNQDIVHRDIKPENVLMTSLDDGARVVLTDFGNARYLPEASRQNQVQRMFSCVGTLAYSAPEVYRAGGPNGYSKSVDMWSIGSITTTLLAGEPLFAERHESENRKHVFSRIEQCDLSILDSEYHPVWSTASDRPKDFIKRLLVIEEERRMTVTEALAHVWFSDPYFAADFEDLYKRSIKDWQPRIQDAQLIEQVASPAPDTASLKENHAVSEFFPKVPEHDILRSLSVAGRQRANTPLPAVGDDYDCGQFASPVCAPTQEQNTGHGIGRSESNHNGRLDSIDDSVTPVYDEYHTYDSDAFDDSLPTLPPSTQGEYRGASNDDYGDSTSLDEVMDETYEVIGENEYREDVTRLVGDADVLYSNDHEDEVNDVGAVPETPTKETSR
jgi:serine/threonine protein kinase